MMEEKQLRESGKLNLLRDAPDTLYQDRIARLNAIEEAQRADIAYAEVRSEMLVMMGLLHSLPDMIAQHVSGAITHFETLAHVQEVTISTLVENQKDVFEVRAGQMQSEIHALRRQVALLSQIVAKLELELVTKTTKNA